MKCIFQHLRSIQERIDTKEWIKATINHCYNLSFTSIQERIDMKLDPNKNKRTWQWPVNVQTRTGVGLTYVHVWQTNIWFSKLIEMNAFLMTTCTVNNKLLALDLQLQQNTAWSLAVLSSTFVLLEINQRLHLLAKRQRLFNESNRTFSK